MQKIGLKKIVAFAPIWLYGANGDDLFGVHSENDVATNKLKPEPGTGLAMHDKAEAIKLANPKLVKP